MENFNWRTDAREVAYMNMFLWISNLVMTIVSIFESKLVESATPPSTVVYWRDWFIIALHALVSGIQLWASFKLLSATEYGRDVKEALEKARIWRSVTIAFLFIAVSSATLGVLGVVFGVVANGWRLVVIGVIYIILYGIYLLVVYRFVRELEKALPSGGTATASGV